MHPNPSAQWFFGKIFGMLKSLLLNERDIGRDEAELLGRDLIDEFIVIVGLRRFFTSLATLRAHFSLFARL